MQTPPSARVTQSPEGTAFDKVFVIATLNSEGSIMENVAQCDATRE
jgi:hypothetical protein